MLLEQIKNSIFVENTKQMKKIIGLCALLLLFNSCDDGDLTIKKFNFDTSAKVETCSGKGLFFKIKNNEALILSIPVTSFPNVVTPENQPTTIIISATNKVTYRLFDSNVTTSYFCEILPPATPTVLEEWYANNGVTAVSGLIEITTTEIINPTTTLLTGYNHLIVFKNITFTKGGNSFTYDTYTFGSYITSL
jgi:hypothetical protein